MLPFGLFSVGKASGYHGTGLSKQLNVFWNVVGERVRSCFETDSKKKRRGNLPRKGVFQVPFCFCFPTKQLNATACEHGTPVNRILRTAAGLFVRCF